jgi:hypothetical protein
MSSEDFKRTAKLARSLLLAQSSVVEARLLDVPPLTPPWPVCCRATLMPVAAGSLAIPQRRRRRLPELPELERRRRWPAPCLPRRARRPLARRVWRS